MQRTNNMKKTAEAVSLGHPDKTADYISSYILDRMIEQDANVRYAVEVMIKDNTVVLGGEISGDVNLANVKDYVVAALGEIGYDEFYSLRWGDDAINPAKIQVINLIGRQSKRLGRSRLVCWLRLQRCRQYQQRTVFGEKTLRRFV